MLDKVKVLWNRLSQRFDGNLAKNADVTEFDELERTRRKLADMRFRHGGSESSGSFAMDAVRRRITEDLSEKQIPDVRQRNRQALNKWLHREDMYDSGVFDATEFDRRLDETRREGYDVVPLQPLPTVEDTFIAFSRPEENLFEESSISLSGIHYKVDPLEDADETVPGLPMYGRKTVNDIDFTPLPVVDCSPDEIVRTSSNPMIQVLNELEERMSSSANRKEGYWLE